MKYISILSIITSSLLAFSTTSTNNVNQNQNKFQYTLEDLKNGFIEDKVNNITNSGNNSQSVTPPTQNAVLQLQNDGNMTKSTVDLSKKKIISNDVIDENAQALASDEKCSIFLKYLGEASYQKGFEIGKINSIYEIESKLKKLKTFLDSIFRIKDFYVEGVLEPPLIEEDRNSQILDNGKTFIKKEVTYKIAKPSKFKEALTWEDFLLQDKNSKLTEPRYLIKYQFFYNPECEDMDKVYETLNTNFYKGYGDSKEETSFLYKERLKSLNKYMDGLYQYQRLYLTKKIEPPLITTQISPIDKNKNNKTMTISEEKYYILKDAEFVDNYKKWENYLIQNNPTRAMPMNEAREGNPYDK